MRTACMPSAGRPSPRRVLALFNLTPMLNLTQCLYRQCRAVNAETPRRRSLWNTRLSAMLHAEAVSAQHLGPNMLAGKPAVLGRCRRSWR